jgi:hypothetical protein
LKSKLERNLAAIYANTHGLTTKQCLCEAVSNFLNYIIPRAAGLPEESSLFNERYEWFDNSLYGDACLVTTFSILGNIWDNAGRVSLADQFSLRYVIAPSFAVPADNRTMRERMVCALEIKGRARPIGWGRDITGENAFFILEHSAFLPMKGNVIAAAYKLRDETSKKFILATRLLGHSTSFSDYRGYRMVGSLAGHEMDLMNFPDDFVGRAQSFELSERDGVCIRQLLPRLATMKYEEMQLLDTKLDDILRRERQTFLGEEITSLKVAIEQLLDCFQILEAIMEVAGSEYVALYAAVLLKESGYGPLPQGAADYYGAYEFIKKMFASRNNIMHGRIGKVLNPTTNKSLSSDVQIFRRMVCHLATLSTLNANLREIAAKLAVGAAVQLKSFNQISLDDLNAMRKPQAPYASW